MLFVLSVLWHSLVLVDNISEFLLDVDSEENAEGEGRKPEDRKGESSAEVLEEPEVAVMDLPEESGDGNNFLVTFIRSIYHFQY